MRAAISLLVSLLAACPALAAEQPNIVLIFTDDQGYGDVGCYGAKGFRTPNLDRLAKEGVRFTDFHVSQPVCSASRASLMTGCYANRIGIHGALGPNARHGIHADETTIAEVCKSRGYATGMVGKWHLGHHPQFLPTRHGFDSYFGLPYSNDMWPHHPEAKKGTYPKLPLIENETIIDADVTPEDQPNLTTQYTERAVKFIRASAGKPFFLYVAHSMPHVPLFVSNRHKGKSQQGLYGDVIEEIDWSVGEILKALDESKLADNTLVLFTCDNGPWLSYGNHGGSAGGLREGKGTVWEGGHRVPFIARWPGKIPAGSRLPRNGHDHRPPADGRRDHRGRAPRSQDRRQGHRAALARREEREVPARRLLPLLRAERAPGRARREMEADVARTPTGRCRGSPQGRTASRGATAR